MITELSMSEEIIKTRTTCHCCKKRRKVAHRVSFGFLYENEEKTTLDFLPLCKECSINLWKKVQTCNPFSQRKKSKFDTWFRKEFIEK